MIKITITQVVETTKKANQNFVTKRTPTEIAEESRNTYSSNVTKEIKFVEEFAVREVDQIDRTEVTLLSQQIVDDTRFNLPEVIRAINGLK